MRRGILKRAICDLKGRGGRWTNKCDNVSAILSWESSGVYDVVAGEIKLFQRLIAAHEYFPTRSMSPK